MPATTKKFQGVEYVIDDSADELIVTGKKVEAYKDETGQYISRERPYQRFNSLDELAEEIINSSTNQ